MKDFSASPKEIISSFWVNRNLIKALTKREILGRYQGSMLGILWSFFNPLLMLLVYTFVFSVIFKSRWSAQSDSKIEFALVLFIGMFIFGIFSECIGRAPSLIVGNANYVKKVVFPLEILIPVVLNAALFHAAISLLVWFIVYVIAFGVPHITFLFLPIIIIPLVFLTLGFSWFLASLGVYLRDVSQFIGVFITILMFLTPIFYPPTALPENYRFIFDFNPIAVIVSQTRDILYFGKIPDISLYLFCLIGSMIIAILGFAWFQKTRKGFADVI